MQLLYNNVNTSLYCHNFEVNGINGINGIKHKIISLFDYNKTLAMLCIIAFPVVEYYNC